MISLQRLEGFYWVARTKGYARAARAFPWPISQPGVHQQVSRLEKELGVVLFERVNRDNVTLTAHGQALYAHVAPFYEQLGSIAASFKTGTVGGTLKVDAAGHLLRHLLPGWLKRLSDARPDIDVQLTEVPAVDIERLRRGDSDLLVDWLPEVPRGIAVQQVAQMKAFVVVPSRGPLAQQHSLAALAKAPFIAYHQDRTLRGLQEKALALHGLEPRHAYAADSADTILAFVAAGLGWSLVASLEEKGPKLSGVEAFPLERPVMKFPIVAAWRDAGPHPLVRAMLKCAAS